MYDLTKFTQSEVNECGNALRSLGSGAGNMEEVANRVVRHLYDNLLDGANQKACGLVRFYKTHPYDQLDSGLQQFAQGILGRVPEPGVNCLTMLATAGDQPDWNSRAKSNGHKAIPLASAEMVATIPMVSRLISQFGMDVGAVLQPDPLLIGDMVQRTYNTFYIPEAVGSPYIPAQDDFVIPTGIKSVVGYGGVLSSGNLFAVIVFCKAAIPQDVADRFRDLAAGTKDAVQSFVSGPVFAA